MNSLNQDYDPVAIENKWYKHWLDKNYFHAEEESDKESFCIVIPLPNITGQLHMGHALMIAIQDILTRHKRMQGYNTLWLPGTDHAGIATQTVVERALAKEGKTRWDLGRKAFVDYVWEWKAQKGGRITEQLKHLGASLDWERERFTLDEGLSKAVREVFVSLYEQGLIYQDNKLINWCPRCHTALSDLEVEHLENHPGEMWSFAYPIADGGEIVVATTRPETMLGDSAVAVHPEDERYKHLVGKMVKHPLVNREFPIVADEILVDREFGTGAVKITPAHDFNDFEVGKRHKLDVISILTEDGKMNGECGEFEGMNVNEARKAVKAKLAEMGLERGSEPHTMAIGRCQRCDTIVEPFLSKQWFVKIQPLADKAIKVVEEGKVTFTPKQWEKTYFNWMYNIQDWCISRQLWWGHQIPVWYCDDCGETCVSRQDITKCTECGSDNLRRDEDVLDTWFSSALWPFSTLGWPEKTKDLSTFYPTTIMETGFDIIFFWVARMIMMGMHFAGDVPFKKVYLHAMVRDWEGNKMSKTRGNVIDPLALINGAKSEDLPEKVAAKFKDGFPSCGGDALRFTLAVMAAQGRDVKLDPKRVEGYRFFANKLYNASRFALRFFGDDFTPDASLLENDKNVYNLWIRSELERLIETVNNGIETFRLDESANGLYHFIWRNFCDWYIELTKQILYDENHPDREATRQTLYHALSTVIKLLHPIMPSITEEIWHAMPHVEGEAESVIVAEFPKAGSFTYDKNAADEVEMVIEAVTLPRNLRPMVGLAPSQKVPGVYFVRDEKMAKRFKNHEPAIKKLAGLSEFKITASSERPEKSLANVGKYIDCFLPLEGLLDVEKEKARLEKELGKLDKTLKGVEAKLGNEKFISKAPTEVIEKAKNNRDELISQRDRLADTMKQLG